MTPAFKRAGFGLVVVAATIAGCSERTISNATFLIQNDIGIPAVLAICLDGACNRLAPTDYRPTLAPDGALPVNVDITGIPTTYRVIIDGDTKNPRCLTLKYVGGNAKDIVAKLSAARACAL